MLREACATPRPVEESRYQRLGKRGLAVSLEYVERGDLFGGYVLDGAGDLAVAREEELKGAVVK